MDTAGGSSSAHEHEDTAELDDDIGDLPSPTLLAAPQTLNRLVRSNTTSTVYVEETMSHPDDKKLILFVSKRILEEFSDAPPPTVQDDLTSMIEASGLGEHLKPSKFIDPHNKEGDPQAPAELSEAEVCNFMGNIFKTAQLTTECTIIAMEYLSRFITSGGDRLRKETWRPLIMTAMLLASKVWDDLSMVNEDFSILLPFSIQQINKWEAAFLTAMGFNVSVTASQYTKYYFELRDRIKAAEGDGIAKRMKPLSHSCAEKLEVLSSSEEGRLKKENMGLAPAPRRCVSLGGSEIASKRRTILD